MNKIMRIIFLFSTAFLVIPLSVAADIPYCAGTEKPFDSKDAALQKVFARITSNDCVIGNNCISSAEPYISYTVRLEEKKDANAVKCSRGTAVTVRCEDGVAKPGEERTGSCKVVVGAGSPQIVESYNFPPL